MSVLIAENLAIPGALRKNPVVGPPQDPKNDVVASLGGTRRIAGGAR